MRTHPDVLDILDIRAEKDVYTLSDKSPLDLSFVGDDVYVSA